MALFDDINEVVVEQLHVDSDADYSDFKKDYTPSKAVQNFLDNFAEVNPQVIVLEELDNFLAKEMKTVTSITQAIEYIEAYSKPV